jgi:hypothetical protein
MAEQISPSTKKSIYPEIGRVENFAHVERRSFTPMLTGLFQ